MGNRLYGRGTLDMKSRLLANWFALKMLLDLGVRPGGDYPATQHHWVRSRWRLGSGSQSVNLNPETMRAGDWVSSLADEAILECRIGFVHGETRADIKRLIEETVADAAKGDVWLEEHPTKIEWFG